MVAKIKTGTSIKGVLNYNEHKVAEGKAECIGENLFGKAITALNFHEKLERFTRLNTLRPRLKTNTVHISLNFDPSEKPDNDAMNRIAASYLENIGFGDQPYLVYRHNDAAHPHIHLVTTNICSNGESISLHNLARDKSEPARKEVEILYDLVKAGSQTQRAVELKPVKLIAAEYGRAETKRAISNIVHGVISEYKFTTLAQFNAVLKCFNVVADPGAPGSAMKQNSGLNYFITDDQGKKQGMPIKASIIYGTPTLKILHKKFLSDMERRAPLKLKVSAILNDVLRQPMLSKAVFADRLNDHGIQAIFYSNKDSLVYGVTFVDHANKVVFTGSELGKAYSISALAARFDPGLSTGTTTLKASTQLNKANKKMPVLPVTQSIPGQPRETNPNGNSILDDLLLAKSFDAQVPGQLKRRKKRKRPTQ